MIRLCFVLCCLSYHVQGQIILKIGGVFGSEVFDTEGEEAFRLAINYVNERNDLLPNVTLDYVSNRTLTPGVFQAMTKTCELLQAGVVSIVGPATTTDVKAVSHILSARHMPQMSPIATDPTLSIETQQYPYLFKMSAPDTYQSDAILSIIENYGWTRIGIIASAMDYGRNGLTKLQTEALKRDWTITSVSYFYPSDDLSSEQIRQILTVIQNKGTRVVVLNCLARFARIILDEAFNLGMLSQGWAWITTDGVTATDELYNESPTVPSHLHGILGTRPAVPRGGLYDYFKVQWENKSTDANYELYAMLVFDAVLMASYGIHRYLADGNTLSVPQFDTCLDPEALPWENGSLLREYIANASGAGVVHDLAFNTKQYTTSTDYDMVNLQKSGWNQVGVWTQNETGGFLEITEPVMFPGATTNVPEDTRLNLLNVTLRVVTILESPFTMETEESTHDYDWPYEGFCIDLLHRLSTDLQFDYELYIVPDNSYGALDPVSGKWNGLVGELMYGYADLVVAPLTITYEREQVIDFTKPFMDLGNIIIMAKEPPQQHWLAFLDPFATTLWLAVGAAFLVIGMANTLISWLSPFGNRGVYSSRRDRSSDKYKDDRNYFNLWNSLWYSFSVWAMQGAETSPRCLSGRLVYGAWYFATMIISATYTANLAAFLTVQRLDGGISNLEDLAKQTELKYGTVRDTAVSEFFKIQITEPYVGMYAFMEQHDTYVSNTSVSLQMVMNSYGKPRGERFAFIFDSATLEYAASQPPCNMVTVGRLFNQFGYGLALPKHSPYSDMLSLQILRLRQSGFLSTKAAQWITSGSCNAESEESTTGAAAEQATLEQMAGVFMLTAGILVFALVVVMFEYFTAARTDVIKSREKGNTWCGAFSKRFQMIRRDIRQNFGTCIGCQHETNIDDRYADQHDNVTAVDMNETDLYLQNRTNGTDCIERRHKSSQFDKRYDFACNI